MADTSYLTGGKRQSGPKVHTQRAANIELEIFEKFTYMICETASDSQLGLTKPSDQMHHRPSPRARTLRSYSKARSQRRAEVLTSPDLLLYILSRLPHRTLVVAQGVNKMWQHIILSSRSLQARLFFVSPTSRHGRAEYVANPILTECFPLFYRREGTNVTVGGMAVNFAEHIKDWDNNPEIWRRKEATWRKMLVFSGGDETKDMEVRMDTYGMAGHSFSEGIMSLQPMNESPIYPLGPGLRLITLFCLTRSQCYSDSGSFSIRWNEEGTYIEKISFGISLSCTGYDGPHLSANVCFLRYDDVDKWERESTHVEYGKWEHRGFDDDADL